MSDLSTPNTPLKASAESSIPVAAISSEEDELRQQLHEVMRSLNRREPLEPTYKKLLQNNSLTRRPATIPKTKFYKRIRSRLRERVETYFREMQGKDPFDRISQRQPLEEASMRGAFTLRTSKEHEQAPLLAATLAAMGMHPERKRSLDGMALGLQARKDKKLRSYSPLPPSMTSTVDKNEEALQQAELERQRAQARQWEEARMRWEAEERRSREEDLRKKKLEASNSMEAKLNVYIETVFKKKIWDMEEERRSREEDLRKKKLEASNSMEAKLNAYIKPVFKKLWDMEFSNIPSLSGSNPFRIVIDKESAPFIAPGYMDVITTPMNLTYIQEKVQKMKYLTLQEFFRDVDLMIENALKYNVEEDNPYRIAALEVKKLNAKMAKKVWDHVKQSQNK